MEKDNLKESPRASYWVKVGDRPAIDLSGNNGPSAVPEQGKSQANSDIAEVLVCDVPIDSLLSFDRSNLDSLYDAEMDGPSRRKQCLKFIKKIGIKDDIAKINPEVVIIDNGINLEVDTFDEVEACQVLARLEGVRDRLLGYFDSRSLLVVVL